jgi:hypothetical protein
MAMRGKQRERHYDTITEFPRSTASKGKAKRRCCRITTAHRSHHAIVLILGILAPLFEQLTIFMEIVAAGMGVPPSHADQGTADRDYPWNFVSEWPGRETSPEQARQFA